VRIDGDSTVEVSAPQRPVAGPDPLDTKPGYFRAASDDGNRVLFTSCEKLTEDSTAVGSSAECNNDAINDLYAYGVDTETLVDLTTADPSGGAVLGVAAISDDASTVYFVARGVLADGASAGAPNLYLLRGGETTFVGTLSEADSAVWALPGNDVYNSRATPDGDHLAFLSSADLTAGADSGNDQVYLYDAGDDSLVCASCDPAGGFEAAASLQPPGASQVGRDYVSLPQPLSDDGQRLFFNTPQPLVPEDGNGKVDVYAYTASGAELLSSGRSSENSYLLQASPSGDDVFITTYERLVGADVDFNADVYDARVGGGFPEPPAPSPPCLGEACQQAPPAAAPAVPGSDGYSGSGNVKWSANARCQSFAQKADRVRSEAKALRQKAAHSPPKQAKRLRKQATQKSGTAQQMQRKAKQCRGGGA
jgi:hypothetical protein